MFVETLDGHLVNTEMISHVGPQGTVSLTGGSVVVMNPDEISALRGELKAKLLVERPEHGGAAQGAGADSADESAELAQAKQRGKHKK